MFNSNKQLSPSGSGAKKAQTTKTSAFVNAAQKINNITLTGNGGVALKSSLNDFLDQFGNVSSFKAIRPYADIARDMQLLYSQDKTKALKFLMYLRLVSRQVRLFDGTKTERVQNGQGLKHESIMRMLWLGVNDPQVFKSNLQLFVSVGSFNDIIKMMSYDVRSNGFEDRKLDWKFLADFLNTALGNENVSDLVKKYLPQIKSSSKQKTQNAIADTIIAKYLASVFFGTKNGDFRSYKQYRQMKTSGSAHEWQKLVSKRLFNEINFSSVSGRALAIMAGSKFLSNQNLEDKYTQWLEKQPVAKYTGFPYELMSVVKQRGQNLNISMIQRNTINKQFATLVELGTNGLAEGENGFIGVVDTSGSMTSLCSGTNVSSYDVALSMALYMSEMTKSSAFSNAWIEFNSTAKLHTWAGSTPVDKLQNFRGSYNGSTNILDVATLLVSTLRSGVSESDFPSGIVCFSDREFNRTGQHRAFDAFRQQMINGGFSRDFVSKFKIVLWDIPNGYYSSNEQSIQFYKDQPNSYSLSGLDGSVLKFILGTEDQVRNNKMPSTAEELMDATLDQEIFQLVRTQ